MSQSSDSPEDHVEYWDTLQEFVLQAGLASNYKFYLMSFFLSISIFLYIYLSHFYLSIQLILMLLNLATFGKGENGPGQETSQPPLRLLLGHVLVHGRAAEEDALFCC